MAHRVSIIQDRQAATAMEIGLVGPILIAAIFIVMQITLAFLCQDTLDFALGKEARQVKIGNVTDLSTLKTDVCKDVVFMPSCTNNLALTSQAGSSFAGLSGSGLGGSQSYVLVTATYQMPWLSKPLGTPITITSAMAFENEPF